MLVEIYKISKSEQWRITKEEEWTSIDYWYWMVTQLVNNHYLLRKSILDKQATIQVNVLQKRIGKEKVKKVFKYFVENAPFYQSKYNFKHCLKPSFFLSFAKNILSDIEYPQRLSSITPVVNWKFNISDFKQKKKIRTRDWRNLPADRWSATTISSCFRDNGINLMKIKNTKEVNDFISKDRDFFLLFMKMFVEKFKFIEANFKLSNPFHINFIIKCYPALVKFLQLDGISNNDRNYR